MLRGLFVTLVDLDGANATKLLEEFGWSMAIDLEPVRVVALDPIVAQDERQAPSTVAMQRLLKDLSARFQSNGTSLAAYGLPEPTGEADEVTMHRDAFHGIQCQQFVDENLAKLTSSEQQPIFDTVVEAVEKKTPLCVFVQGRAGCGKTLLMSVITAELQRRCVEGTLSFAQQLLGLQHWTMWVGQQPTICSRSQ